MFPTMSCSFIGRLLDTIARRRCCVCRRPLAASEQYLCTECNYLYPRTDYLSRPYDNPLAQVYWGRVRCVERAAAFAYHYAHSESAHPIYQLKYFSRPQLGIALGRLFGQEMVSSGFSQGIDLMMPIPLAASRLKQRGYNQSLMLARGLSAATGIPVDDTFLARTQFAGSQTQRNRWQRVENVKDTFVLRSPSGLAGKHILLVDDVVTSGATSCACANALEKAHPAAISISCLAFVDPEH